MSISLKPIIIQMPEKYKDFKKIPIQRNFGLADRPVKEEVKENIVEDRTRKCEKCGGYISKKLEKCPFCNL